MDALRHDIRHGIRQLFRQRGSSVVAVLTLALGIGTSSALFSVVDATMLRPLPYPHPEQLVSVVSEEVQPDGELVRLTPSMEDMRAWQAAGDVFTSVAGYGRTFGGRIVDGPEPERVEVQELTEDYLAMHGVAPVLGRGFRREDCDAGAPLVALLGYGYWQSHYGGRRDVIGQTLRLDADVATIIGVLPAWFDATTPISTPLRIPPDELSRRGTGREVYGRLRPAVTIEQARVQLSAGMAGTPPVGRSAAEVRVGVTSRLESAMSRYRTTVTVFAAAVGLILLIAVVNVAGLLLARGAVRQSELAVRASLGASRGRLIRQLLTESAVLALPGGAIGVLLAWLSLDAIVANIPMALPTNSPVSMNPVVLASTMALLIPTALLCGLVPAVRLSRTRIGPVMARDARQMGSALSRRGGQVLIAAEIALAMILVTSAGLMIRSFVRISAVDLGFNPNGLLTMTVMPMEGNAETRKEYYKALLQQVRTIPGISAAGVVDYLPIGDSTSFSSISIAGRPTGAAVFQMMPGYLEAIDATLRAGRLPTEADDAPGFRGVVINESASRALFPGSTAVGREISRSTRDTRPWIVVGVVADLRHGGPLAARSLGQLQVFFPFEPAESDRARSMMVVLRASGTVPGIAGRLRHAAQSIGPRVLVEQIRTGEDWFADRVMTPRRRTALLGLLGGLGLTLSLVGVFGMTAYAVTRRTYEIGVRLAFGARPGQVVRTIVGDAAVPIAIGTVLGVGGAALATRGIESFLFNTTPTDPVTLAAAAVALAAAGCLAALLPALRAARVDPVSSLHAD